jgi:CubicO group peptidase (beta-lactamase class C family)
MDPIIEPLRAHLKQLAALDQFSGSVVVAKDGAPFFEDACGLADIAHQAPNKVDTRFNLGSMNKMFTAVATGRLVAMGKLGLSDTVGTHLPAYPNRLVAEIVTVHHLLCHTSGLGDYFTPEFFAASRERCRTVKDFLPLFVDRPLAFAPGLDFQYSNAGYVVLGALIEAVSGRDYFDYVREEVYERAGMRDTDSYELDRATPNLATGYTGAPGCDRRNNLFMHVIKGTPAGGGFSTAPDLIRFARGLQGHELLPADLTELFLAGKIESGRDRKYGYGFVEERIGEVRIVGHAGGFAGLSAQLDMYPELGFSAAVLSNYDPPAAAQVAGRIRELIIATCTGK